MILTSLDNIRLAPYIGTTVTTTSEEDTMTTPCLTGACDHSPYDSECADPAYVEQPCCGMKVHVGDFMSDDETQHVDCPLFPDE